MDDRQVGIYSKHEIKLEEQAVIRAGIVALLLAVVLSVGYAVDPVRNLIEASIAGEIDSR